MTAEQFKILKEGNILKVGKNQIYFDDFSDNRPYFIVEKFEYENNGHDNFSLIGGFNSFKLAYEVAKDLNKYLKSHRY